MVLKSLKAFVLVLFFSFASNALHAQSSDAQIEGEQIEGDQLEEELLEGPTLEEVRFGCLNGDAKLCFELGLMHDFGEGMEEDNQNAMLLYFQACDANFVPACLEVAAKHRLGDEVELSNKIAMELYEKACELDDPNGCYFWGNMVQDGADGLQPDLVKAASLYDKACELELGYACFDSAMTLLGNADLEAGLGTPKAKKIFGLFAKGCDLGEGDSCFGLSSAHSVGYGTEANTELAKEFAIEAREIWSIACEEGDEIACEYVAE